MTMRCKICRHPEQESIERAMISRVSNRRIATQYGMSEASVRRHWPHLIKGIAGAVKRARERGESIW